MTDSRKIRGYKSFAFDYTNQAGERMEAGKIYHCPGEIKYNHNGLHMAQNFEDTIAFSDKVDENGNPKPLHDVVIAEVIGFGDIDCVDESYSEYYGYYNLYACSDMEVVRFISRAELISMALRLNNIRMKRFVSDIKLSPKEIELFKGIFASVDLAIAYHQEGNKEAYNLEYSSEVYNSYYKNLRR